MKVFQAAKSVELSLPLIDDAARTLVVTSASYIVYDDDGEVVQEATSLSTPISGSTKITVTVPDSANTLEVDETIGYRRVDVLLTCDSRTEPVTLSSEYLLEAQQLFIIPKNSFQTYETALVTARKMTPTPGWDAASVEARKFALFRAFDLMKTFAYVMRYTERSEEVLTIDEWTDSTWAWLSTAQIQDFRKAQLIQADYILGGNPIEKDIQDGLQSSTIGEVSQFYRPRPTLSLALCRAALSYVGKYIQWNVRIGRT